MEPDERLTKRERRERARQERRQKEIEQRRAARRRRLLTIGGTVVGVAAVAALIWVTTEPAPETGIVLSRAEADRAYEEAGCVAPEIPDPQSTAHLAEDAPPAEQLYPHRPTHAGPHFPTTHPVGVFDEAIDERNTTHNLEHGAVVVWHDPDQVSDDDISAIAEWARERNRAGFQNRGGAGIIAAPFPDGLDSGKALALRAWMVATDCDGWDESVGDAFLINNYGTAGLAPEAHLAPYPQDVLAFEGEEDPGEAPEDTDGAGEGGEADDGEEPAGEDGTGDGAEDGTDDAEG